jgi:hypothetical protein
LYPAKNLNRIDRGLTIFNLQIRAACGDRRTTADDACAYVPNRGLCV